MPIREYPTVDITGLQDAIIVEHAPDLALSDGVIAFEMLPDTVSSRQGLVSKDAAYYGDGGHLTVWMVNGKIEARIQSDGKSFTVAGGTVEAGTAAHVAVSFGADGLELYVDGVLVDSDAYTGGLTGNAEPLVIGASQWGSSEGTADALTHEYAGAIGPVEIYDRQLSEGEIAALSEGLPAEPAPANQAPFVFVPDTGQELSEGEAKTIDVAHLFRDPDGDALTYALVDAPDFVTIDGTVVTVSPGYDDAGTYEIGVTASDGQATSAPASIVYEIANATPPPPQQTNVQTFEAEDFDATQGVGVFTQGGNRQIGSTQDGEWVRYDAVDFGTDPSAEQTLDLKVSSGSSGGTLEVRIGAPDGTLLATHTTGNTGGWASYDDVTLDLGSLTGTEDLYFVFRGGARSIMDIDSFTLTTGSGADPDNLPPTVDPNFDSLERPENSAALYNLDAVFADPEGADLTYRILEAPDFVSIVGSSLEILPRDGDDGTYTISVGADDGVNVSAPWTFELTVTDNVNPPPANQAPFVFVPDTGQELSEGEAKTIDVAHLFRDPDGDALTYALVDAPDFVTIDDTVVTVSPGYDDAGTYEIGVTASDGQATSAPASIVYEIANATPPAPSETSIRLDAGPDALERNADGSYDWGAGVTLTGYERDGDLAEVVFSTQFKDHGFGVAGEGSRWDGQIDFYDVNGGESETIVIDFDSPVDDVFLFVGMLGANEGGRDFDETGLWVAKDADGQTIGTGLIGPEQSTLGEDVKEDGSYGIYPIAIDVDGIASLELTATQFGHGTGTSKTQSYGENSSDFNIMALEFETSADTMALL